MMKSANLKYYFFLLNTIIVLAVIVLIVPSDIRSAASDNVSGWAWSETIGWISFNCTNTGSCGTSTYGVTVGTNKKITGYAWSEHIGWVSFKKEDTTNCPSGSCEAKLKTDGTIEGWARALAGIGAIGWDGWIHLGGSNYGVFVNGCNWDGWAWGSDTVGWIHFRGTNYGVQGSGDACGFGYSMSNSGNIMVAPGSSGSNTITLTSTGNGSAPNVSLSTSGLPSGASASFNPNNCKPTCSSIHTISTSASTPLGSYPITVTGTPLNKTTSFTLTVSSVITSFTATPSAINPGDSSTLSWTSSGFTSCSINQGVGSVPVNGSQSVSPTLTTIYTLSCTGPSGSDSKNATVTVAKVPVFKEITP